MPPRRQMPADFPQYALRPYRDLVERYRCCHTMIARWRRELGIVVPGGAPKGNRNSAGNQSQSKRKETHGIDGPEAVRTCLSCTRLKCTGSCMKVR